ncbi:N-acetyl-alpha-D-glucosaminyl L-malate synthase BshA [Candidatus Uhrbacteria bacterium RIFCSPHIGHO2_12_FULL_54_23]|uniref:N-acetyl-alpha-D-glucosaminyl L-malate synthase BshA n=3 Tax=Candidatus Uhriibacteriota TaxID=1752732 RepID=A0A1F7UJ78_9BACT|nr:MAG: N-acetyl-alpha-D-glucosaminyl L-malate synthase BshA [Candidatus Uhrbacteria bacterium RIFCSPHIGHO2_12_FULL_54_23]OGL85728.1 MAG: N-acetyl-alpha-D-glucosaminyl L-malate synthase BshA [Candidatus Uhrbacteria bacterium RIFCSPLOWO2_01_FULL_55_36]OGL89731.1 MAG: N-acetyl-alpha-D-glucosaminyl L-malate synthase BshA [Candidatus Uhrbacteria bacterium RIFCSPLOWO2_02_FULL_54_37]
MKKLRIGITCYPTIGGSGIVATELGAELARRGHEVHFISYDPPFRLDLKQKGIFFHQVGLNEYRLFKYPDYTLPLAVKMFEVSVRHRLDILHVHYAVPHATAALLARKIAGKKASARPRVVTTLHGTDITLVGNDPKLYPIVKYSIEQSCGVTAVSRDLRAITQKEFKLKKHIEVIYNFYTPRRPRMRRDTMRKKLGIRTDDFMLIHLSNLRPVKRIPDLLRILARLKSHPSIKLLLLAGAPFKEFLPLVQRLNVGKQLVMRENVRDIENYIPAADAGIFTSEDESFGMGMLETMSYGVPVLATRVGGVPEVARDGITGYLYRVGDLKGFADGVMRLARDRALKDRLGTQAAVRARTWFSADAVVGEYERYYYRVLKNC